VALQICLVGLSHKTAPIAVREKVAIDPAAYGEVLATWSGLPSLAEMMLLSTCNRTEIYGVCESYHAGMRSLEGAMLGLARRSGVDVGPHLYARHGAAAARHLFRVAASLDSLIVGEPQILGQVKDAWRAAADAGRTGGVLDRLGAHVLEAGKRVRAETEIGAYAVSVSSAGVELAKKIFGRLEGRHALVIGAGEMAELTLRHLQASGVTEITVANRTRATATPLGEAFGARVMTLEGLPDALVPADIVIASAASPVPLVRRRDVERAMKERKSRPVFFIDLALPRNVEPSVARVYNVYLYDLDDLQRAAAENQGRRVREAERAEQIVEQELARFLQWFEGLETVPTIVALRERMEALRDEESRRLLAKLAHLSQRDRERVEQFGAALVQKILHAPLSQLRHVGDAERAAQLAASLRYLFRLDDGEARHDAAAESGPGESSARVAGETDRGNEPPAG
jgi:glutamyl-tRNA reductase